MASDMWSLGVVFLELSTILLGKKLSTFRRHLENSASDKKSQPFVWDRIRATYDWLDDLRIDNNTGAEQDNEVLTWTRDLLKKQPKERLNSSQLMQRILHSPSFHSFCCFECWPDYERSNRLPKDIRSEEMTAIDATNVNDQVTTLFEQEPVDDSKNEESERHKTIEDWINSTRAESANFRTLFSNDTRSGLSTEFTPNFIINQDTEESFNDVNEEELEKEEKTTLAQPPSSNDDTLMPEDNPPPSLSVPGNFPQPEDYEDDHDEIATPKISFNDSNRDSISELARIATIEHNPWAQEDDTSHTETKFNHGMSMDNDLSQNLDLDQNPYEHLKGTQDIPSPEDFRSPTILVDTFGPNVWDDTVEREIVTEGLFSVELNHSKQATDTEPTMDEFYQERIHETSAPQNLSVHRLSGPIEPRDVTQNHIWTKEDVDIVDMKRDQDALIAPLEEKSEDLLLTSASHKKLENGPKIVSQGDTSLAKIKDDEKDDTHKKNPTSSNRSREETDSLKSLTKPNETKHQPESSTGKNEAEKDHDSYKKKASSSTKFLQKTDSSNNLSKSHDKKHASEASTSRMKNEVDKGHGSHKRKASSSNKSTKKKASLKSLPESLSSDSNFPASGIEELGPSILVVKDWTSIRNDRSKELQEIRQISLRTNDKDAKGRDKVVPRGPVATDSSSTRNDKNKEQDTKDILSKLKQKETNNKEKSVKTERLSLLNIAIHNAAQKKLDEEAKSDPKKKPYTVFSPQVYMETAWEAASTQVTQNTGKSLHTISLRRWWDRDIRLLESMCRDGNAPAVRLLLKEGCNPGTEEKPRASPLLLAVKGGTAQHYKCV